jgi:hypothetical protein
LFPVAQLKRCIAAFGSLLTNATGSTSPKVTSEPAAHEAAVQTDAVAKRLDQEQRLRERTEERVKQVCDTTKWLITAFAGVAAVLVAGLSLTSFSALAAAPDSETRLVVAGLAIALGTVALVAGIGSASSVLIPVLPSLSLVENDNGPYVKPFKTEPMYLSGYPTFSALREAHDKAVADRATAEAAYAMAKPGSAARSRAVGSGRLEIETARKRMLSSQQEVQRVRNQTAAVLPTFAMLITLQRFRTARIVMSFSAVATIASVGMIAWALNPPPFRTVVVNASAEAPRVVSVRFADNLSPTVRSLIGARCGQTTPVSALLLGGDADNLDVVLIPSRGCYPVRLNITQAMASVS